MTQSWATTAATRASMLANRSRDAGPELAVRRLVHAMGLRYRVNARPVPTLRRTADLVFTRQRVGVLIDGCYWRGCPEHHCQPRANADYWSAKMARNQARDAATDEALRAAGWTAALSTADKDIAAKIVSATTELNGRGFSESPETVQALDVPLAPPPDPSYPVNDVIAEATDLDGNHVVLRRGYYDGKRFRVGQDLSQARDNQPQRLHRPDSAQSADKQ